MGAYAHRAEGRFWRGRWGDRASASRQRRAHPRWAFGDGVVVNIDEWPDADAFRKFFDTQTQIPVLMQAAGLEGPPTFEILEAKTGPDEL